MPQWTGPRVREVAQPVPAHIEDTQGFQTVHDLRAQTAEAVIGHVQLLQSAKTNPVGVLRDVKQGGELVLGSKDSLDECQVEKPRWQTGQLVVREIHLL